MALSAELVRAYREAEYVVREPDIVIRVGEPNAPLDALIGKAASAAFLTAANPASEPAGDEENRRSLAELERSLAGLQHFGAEGRDPKQVWPPEPGFLVLGISRMQARRLARRFGQNALVWCERGRAPELELVAKWRLVLDTHVWLDWLAFDDASVLPLKRALAQDRAEIYLDAACAAELERVLGYPVGKRVADPGVQAARLAEARRLARPPDRRLSAAERASLPRCTDADDQKFLELALAARADALLTKDRALLRLARRTPFRIVPPAELPLA
jgi:predicted nucleic acid-binding protein